MVDVICCKYTSDANFLENNSPDNVNSSNYFWRLTSGAELDMVEEENGKLTGFEFKFSSKSIKPPKSWKENYPNSEFSVINRDNYQQFVA